MIKLQKKFYIYKYNNKINIRNNKNIKIKKICNMQNNIINNLNKYLQKIVIQINNKNQ